MTDLADHDVRDAVAARLGAPLAGRPVILGPGLLAGVTRPVRWLAALGCRVLVLATGRGAGPVPEPGEYALTRIALPPSASITDEFRRFDRMVRELPPGAVADIEAFDPDREGVWWAGPFVTNDAPILGRRVLGGRPQAFIDLEDKLLAEEIWAAAGVPAAPHRVVPVEAGALAAASDALATDLGVVWSGDARDGFNGGGNYVRWILDDDDRAAARGFFLPRCDRVRVMPFLEGVPCSIHGFVLPDGTAVLRPVEIATLRNVEERRLVYGGLSSWWDPAPADREEMRDVARRVGEHLRAAYSYRGAFGIDGVLTADGFRPTELNPRLPAGLNVAGGVDLRLLTLLQANLLAGIDTGLTVADVESLLPLLDDHREGSPLAVVEGRTLGGHDDFPVTVTLDADGTGGRVERADADTGSRLVLADTSLGFFAMLDPVRRAGARRPARAGQRRADGVPRPGVRRRLRHPLRRARRPGLKPVPAAPGSAGPARFLGMRVVVVGGGLGGLASAARLAKLGHDVTLVERTGALGGALTFETEDGFAWDRGAHGTLLPAVLRDLFRKSGRPLEKELELEPVDVIRHHRFEDGTEVRLPGGSRGRQVEAFDHLGAGLGQEWVDHVASYADVWETLRRHYLEVPWAPESLPPDTVRAVRRLVDGRDTLHKRLRRDFRDERLRLVAGHRFVAEGHDLRNVPAWLGLLLLPRAAVRRLDRARRLRPAVRGPHRAARDPGRDRADRAPRSPTSWSATAAASPSPPPPAPSTPTPSSCAVDPRRIPALASYVARSMPAIPPVVTHLGLAGDVPDVGHELVLHGEPMLVIRGGGRAPAGHTAWTMHGRGKIAEDMLVALARHGIDVRDRVAVRVDRSPLAQVEETGSAMGVLWQGRGTVRQRLGPTTPIAGVYAAGAHAAPGSQVPFVGLSAALVAQAIGPA